ncbi:MAG: preprotein translocase subunit SecE [Kofleriaceae bacterium]|nr:preprotein translocase subunit SecE [Kofleriaceae bacterium]MCL4223511.1 preprotein translocase subunit SecE [Myxococcales bacterium]
MAQQENAPNKPVHLMYLGGGVTLFYLTQWTIDWLWGYFAGTTPSELYITLVAGVVALGAGIYFYKHERVHTLANEVSAELKKVSWPTAKEVRAATIVVIVMAIISAIILGLFDFVWSNLTELIYGG